MRWPSLPRPAGPRIITRVSEYEGQSTVAIEATQLGLEYTEADKRRIVQEWCDFLSSGPSPLRDLRFVSRTPKRLFDALRGQTQLEALSVKWGDYEDLGALVGLTRLRTLHLKGASAVQDVHPLAQLKNVTDLVIEGLRRARDLSPIASMSGVTELELGGDWMSDRVARIESFSFLRNMPQLRTLLLHTVAADDLDYSAVLDLPALRSVRVMGVPGMRPSIDVLKARTPWSA